MGPCSWCYVADRRFGLPPISPALFEEDISRVCPFLLIKTALGGPWLRWLPTLRASCQELECTRSQSNIESMTPWPHDHMTRFSRRKMAFGTFYESGTRLRKKWGKKQLWSVSLKAAELRRLECWQKICHEIAFKEIFLTHLKCTDNIMILIIIHFMWRCLSWHTRIMDNENTTWNAVKNKHMIHNIT